MNSSEFHFALLNKWRSFLSNFMGSIKNFALNSFQLWSIFLLLAILNQLYWGYDFGSTNHCVQIPILKSYFDSDLYPNDAMVQTRSGYVTLYYYFLGGISQLFGHLEDLFFIAHMCMVALLFYGTYRLTQRLFPGTKSGILAVLQMFPKRFDLQLGGGYIHRVLHTHTDVAISILLWALGFYFEGNTRIAYILLGLCFNINAQTIAHVFPMVALVSFMNRGEKGIRNLFYDWGAFFLSASPCLIWALMTLGGSVTGDWLQILRLRSSSHTFPATWPIQQWISYSFFFGAGALAWAFAKKENLSSKKHSTMGWFGVVFILLCIAGYVFAEFIPVKAVLKAHLFRSTAFFTVFILIYSSYHHETLWKKSVLHKLCAVLGFISLFFEAYRELLPLFLLITLIIEREKLPIWIFLAIPALLLVRAQTPNLFFQTGFDLKPLLRFIAPFLDNPLWLGVLIALFFCIFLKRFTQNSKIRIFTFFISLVFVIGSFWLARRELVIPIAERGEWFQLQLWVQKNSHKNDVFITPPYLEGFRVYSNRSTVGEWKDGTMQFFSDSYGVTWWNRMDDVGYHKEQYDKIDENKAKTLARKYGASFIVFQTPKRLSFPLVFQNNSYVIYKIGL